MHGEAGVLPDPGAIRRRHFLPTGLPARMRFPGWEGEDLASARAAPGSPVSRTGAPTSAPEQRAQAVPARPPCAGMGAHVTAVGSASQVRTPSREGDFGGGTRPEFDRLASHGASDASVDERPGQATIRVRGRCISRRRWSGRCGEQLVNALADRPCPPGLVAQHGGGDSSVAVMGGDEPDAGIAAVQRHRAGRVVEPETEPVAH